MELICNSIQWWLMVESMSNESIFDIFISNSDLGSLAQHGMNFFPHRAEAQEPLTQHGLSEKIGLCSAGHWLTTHARIFLSWVVPGLGGPSKFSSLIIPLDGPTWPLGCTEIDCISYWLPYRWWKLKADGRVVARDNHGNLMFVFLFWKKKKKKKKQQLISPKRIRWKC